MGTGGAWSKIIGQQKAVMWRCSVVTTQDKGLNKQTKKTTFLGNNCAKIFGRLTHSALAIYLLSEQYLIKFLLYV
jgi:hypothetical protein